MSAPVAEAGFTLTLAQPIMAHGEALTSIALRRPTPADARAVKALPYVMGDGSVGLNTEAVTQYLARLAGIPPSSVDQLDIADFNELGWAVANFFLNRGSATSESSSPGSTTSRGSGEPTLN